MANDIIITPGTEDQGGSTDSAPLLKTGQTTCYDTDGYEIPCTGSGQDGEYGQNVAWPNPRFNDNGNGTVTDNLTGLVWLKKADNPAMDWEAALNFANELADPDSGLSDGSTAGDWRLPNRFELGSLLDLEYAGPALCNTAGTEQWQEGDSFTGVRSNAYWSSSTLTRNGKRGWYVSLRTGDAYHLRKRARRGVWPVRDA